MGNDESEQQDVLALDPVLAEFFEHTFQQKCARLLREGKLKSSQSSPSEELKEDTGECVQQECVTVGNTTFSSHGLKLEVSSQGEKSIRIDLDGDMKEPEATSEKSIRIEPGVTCEEPEAASGGPDWAEINKSLTKEEKIEEMVDILWAESLKAKKDLQNIGHQQKRLREDTRHKHELNELKNHHEWEELRETKEFERHLKVRLLNATARSEVRTDAGTRFIWVTMFLMVVVVAAAAVFGGCGVVSRTFDADNMIHNYEHFFDLHSAYKAKVRDLATHSGFYLHETDKKERGKLRMEMVALQSSCRILVATYNADSAKANRDIFKSDELPDRLDMGTCG